MLIGCFLDEVKASIESVLVHLNWELEIVNAEKSLQWIDIPENFHTVWFIVEEQTINNG